MKNPIIDNRLVYDYRFAHRLKRFASYVGHKYSAIDYEIEKDWAYIEAIADILLRYQKETIDKNNADEIDYLTRCAGQKLVTSQNN